MATPAPAAPPPIPLAGLTPPDAPAAVPDGNPDGPLTIPASTLSKLGLSNLKPGDSSLATVRVTIAGSPDAPEAQITAVGEIRPDDPTLDLTSLSNDSQQAPDDLPISDATPASAGEGDPDAPAIPQDDVYSKLGFSPKAPKKKTVSAKDVFGK